MAIEIWQIMWSKSYLSK